MESLRKVNSHFVTKIVNGILTKDRVLECWRSDACCGFKQKKSSNRVTQVHMCTPKKPEALYHFTRKKKKIRTGRTTQARSQRLKSPGRFVSFRNTSVCCRGKHDFQSRPKKQPYERMKIQVTEKYCAKRHTETCTFCWA